MKCVPNLTVECLLLTPKEDPALLPLALILQLEIAVFKVHRILSGGRTMAYFQSNQCVQSMPTFIGLSLSPVAFACQQSRI